jgi:hypothetical protein
MKLLFYKATRRVILAMAVLTTLIEIRPAQIRVLPPSSAGSIAQTRKTSNDILDVYAKLVGRNILQSGELNLRFANAINLDQLSADTNSAARIVETVLSTNGITLLRDGEKFVWAVPSYWNDKPLPAYIQQLLNSTITNLNREFPPGTVVFPAAPAGKVIEMYCAFSNRTPLVSEKLSYTTIRFINTTPLSRDEMLHGLKASMALNGIAVMEDGGTFLQAMPVAAVSEVHLAAPIPQKEDMKINRLDIPVFSGWEQGKPRLPQNIDLPNRPATATHKSPSIDSLIEYYATLIGRKAIPSRTFGKHLVQFVIGTDLTKQELLYAIETTLALNGVKIVTNADTSISAEANK